VSATGEAFTHTVRYLLGWDTAATQTTAPEREAIAKYARDRRLAVEIGVYEAVSTVAMGRSLAPGAILYAVDPFLPGRLGICWNRIIARREVERAKLPCEVSFIRTTSHEALERIRDPEIDFLFIDGDHSLEGITQDWHDWSARVAKGGFVLLHDTHVPAHNPHVADLGSFQYFRDYISRDDRFEIIEIVDSLSVLRRL
jgi:predicted O-methyltransferase YrrM